MRRILASLDMGSNSLKLVIGEFMRNKMNILAVSECTSEGIRCGYITDTDLVIASLKELFGKAEDMIGIPIRKVIACVPAQNALLEIGEGKTTVVNEDHIVKSTDIIRAMQAASYNKISLKEELACIIPSSYTIDETDIVENPLNRKADTLKVKTILVTVPKGNVHPLIDCIEKVGVEVIDISISPLGDYACLENETMKKNTGVIINMGKDTTTVSIFNKGLLVNTGVIELGGHNIEKDIAFVYKLTKANALLVKEKICLAHNRLANPSNQMELTNKLGETIKLDQYEISSIAASRLGEILKLVKKQINLLTKNEIHYIIITGGVTEMPDFSLIVEENFGHHAKIANVTDLGARNNKYSASIGLIKYYDNKLRLRNKDFSIFSLEEQEELSGIGRKINFSENSILGKLFGYFFDN